MPENADFDVAGSKSGVDRIREAELWSIPWAAMENGTGEPSGESIDYGNLETEAIAFLRENPVMFLAASAADRVTARVVRVKPVLVKLRKYVGGTPCIDSIEPESGRARRDWHAGETSDGGPRPGV